MSKHALLIDTNPELALCILLCMLMLMFIPHPPLCRLKGGGQGGGHLSIHGGHLNIHGCGGGGGFGGNGLQPVSGQTIPSFGPSGVVVSPGGGVILSSGGLVCPSLGGVLVCPSLGGLSSFFPLLSSLLPSEGVPPSVDFVA